MSFEEIEQRYRELGQRLQAGEIGDQEFRSELNRLAFQDARGEWWAIGAPSGGWYRFDGAHWVPGQPSRGSTPPPTPPTTTVTGQGRRPRRALLIGAMALLTLLLVLSTWVPTRGLGTSGPAGVLSQNPGGIALPAPHALEPAAAPSVPDSGALAEMITKGDGFAVQSQFDPAMAQYAAAAQLAPSSPTALVHWSRVLAFRGQMLDAIAKAGWAIQRAPDDAEAEAQLARVLAWNSQSEEGDTSDSITQALAAGEQAVQLDPKNSDAHAYLAEIYLLVKRPTDAESQADLALQLAPQSAEAHRSDAWVLTLAGQKEAALGEWRQTVALEPNLFFRHFEFGEALRVFFQDPAGAVSEYQKAISLYASYAPAYPRLGLAYLDVNLPQSAISQFQHAITLDPDDDDSYAGLGLALGDANQCPQAIPDFEQALKIDANNPVAAKGLLECRSGRLPSAPPSTTPTAPLIPPSVDKKSDL